MGLIVDIIVISIIVISGLIAYHNGFVKTFFCFLSTILAIIIACVFCNSFSIHLKDATEIDEFIEDGIISIVDRDKEEISGDVLGELSGDINNDELDSVGIIENDENENIENALTIFLNELPNSINNNFELNELKEEAYQNIAKKVSDVTISIISWIILYVVSKVILACITFVCDGIMSLPILKNINNIAGLIIGIIMGIFRVYFLLAIIYFISTLTNISGVVDVINLSMITNIMYNSNVIISLIF